MFLKIQKSFLNSEKSIILFLILFSFLIRIPAIKIFGDVGLEYEWKPLVNNLIEYKQLAWKNFDGFLLPNLWMPPLYAYYLYVFTFLNLDQSIYIMLILLSQTLMASISVPIFYKINKMFFSKKISFFSSLFFSLFPLHVYAATQISSISLQIFLTIFFLYYLFLIINKQSFRSILVFGFISGLLILLRGEFYGILFLSLCYLFFIKIKIKNILIIILVSLITVSPYLVRNIIIFEKVTVLKSFGYNIWKGNHPYALENSLIVGAEMRDKNLQEKIDNITIDNNYRFKFDKIFRDRTLKNIKKDPWAHLQLVIRKGISFLLIDFNSPDPNYYNPFHYLPILLIGLTSLIGIILSDKKSSKLNYLIFILLIYVAIFSIVSILPRYKLIILPIQLIFTNILIQSIIKKYIR
jgi:4-amino-4-deoxy-L-arabinose transferase-like glycosyltransferase